MRAGAHLFQQAAEAVDVGVVQRGVDLVEDADRGGAREEDGEDEGRRRQRLFAAGHEESWPRRLPGGEA